MTHALSRRSFLVGAGAAVGAATLGGVGSSIAQQMGAASPRRFVFVLRVNGFDSNILMSSGAKQWIGDAKGSPVDDDIWWGTQYNDSRGYGAHATTEVLAKSLSGAPGLRSLESMGLLDRSAVLFGLGSPITGAGHSASHGVLSSTRTLAGRPGGQTLDDFLGTIPAVRGLDAQRTPLSAIRVGVGEKKDGVSYESVASGAGRALPTLLSTEGVWDSYIKPLVDVNGLDDLQRRMRLLTVAKRDAQRALRLDPTNDQLLRYAASVDSQIAEQDIFKQRIDEAMRNGLSDAPTREQSSSNQAVLARMQAQLRNVATILEAGLTNVVVVAIGAGGFNSRFEVGSATTNDGAHELCHQFGSTADTSRAVRNELREVWTREIDAVAALAAHLDSIPEKVGSGTMLDNTAIIYLPDNGVGHHAHGDDYPVLMLGGENMGLRTGGSTIFFPGYKAEKERLELSNLWNTFVHLASGGDTSVSFEAAKKISDKLLPELITT